MVTLGICSFCMFENIGIQGWLVHCMQVRGSGRFLVRRSRWALTEVRSGTPGHDFVGCYEGKSHRRAEYLTEAWNSGHSINCSVIYINHYYLNSRALFWVLMTWCKIHLDTHSEIGKKTNTAIEELKKRRIKKFERTSWGWEVETEGWLNGCPQGVWASYGKFYPAVLHLPGGGQNQGRQDRTGPKNKRGSSRDDKI